MHSSSRTLIEIGVSLRPIKRGQRLVIFGPSKVSEHVLTGPCFRSFLGESEMKNKSEFNKNLSLKLANYFTTLKCFKKITKRQYINRDPHRFKANEWKKKTTCKARIRSWNLWIAPLALGTGAAIHFSSYFLYHNIRLSNMFNQQFNCKLITCGHIEKKEARRTWRYIGKPRPSRKIFACDENRKTYTPYLGEMRISYLKLTSKKYIFDMNVVNAYNQYNLY